MSSLDADLATLRDALTNLCEREAGESTRDEGLAAADRVESVLGEKDAEIARLKTYRDAETRALAQRAQAAERELARLRDGLRFYAERRNYLPPAGTTRPIPGVWIFEHDSFDGHGPGARARALLADSEEGA